MEPITRVYTDAGLIHYSAETPAVAGVWSYCEVAEDDSVVRLRSGIVMPRNIRPAPLESQTMETYAVLIALENMRDGWEGEILSDSREALERFRQMAIWNKRKKLVIPSQGDHILHLACIPASQWVRYSRALRRLGSIRFTRIAGHPTDQDLALGYKTHRNGEVLPVSRHNAACDQACHEAAQRWKERHPAIVEVTAESAAPRWQPDDAPLTQPLFVWRGTSPEIWPGAPIARRGRQDHDPSGT